MEAIPIIIAFVVTGAVWISAMAQKWVRGEASPSEKIEVLQRRHAWLQERLAVALEENWDDAMTAPIVEQLAATSEDLARLGIGPVR